MASKSKPPRSILKHSTSLDRPESAESRKAMKWDEMNILATYHPEGKDYGHMKIDEPSTPYSKSIEPDDDDQEDRRRNSICEDDKDTLDAEQVSERLKGIDSNKTHRASLSPRATSEDDEEEDKTLTPEQQAKHDAFEQKRKLHYNEFQAVKLAKQLMDEEDEDEDEEKA